MFGSKWRILPRLREWSGLDWVAMALFCGAAVGRFLDLHRDGNFDAYFWADSADYTALVGHILDREQLLSYRTFGYPLFLTLVSRLDPSLGIVPVFHFLFFVCGVVGFTLSLIAFGIRRRDSLLLGATLFFSPALDGFLLRWVSTDLIGASMALVTVSALLLTVRPEGGRDPGSCSAWRCFSPTRSDRSFSFWWASSPYWGWR